MEKEHKFDAIVLSANDYKEYDKLLTIFSAVNGKQTVLLRGCKRPKAKLRFAGQPFFWGEFMVVDGKGYDVVTQVSPKNSFFEVTTDYDCYVNGCLALKAIANSCLSQNSERLFLLLVTYLTVLQKNINQSDLITCKFLVELLKLLGFEINTEFCQECGQKFNEHIYYNTFQNCLVCANCKSYDSIKIKPNYINVINTIKSNKFLNLLKVDFEINDVNAVKNLLSTAIERIFN